MVDRFGPGFGDEVQGKGVVPLPLHQAPDPQLAPWAALFRRFAAEEDRVAGGTYSNFCTMVRPSRWDGRSIFGGRAPGVGNAGLLSVRPSGT